MIKENKNTKSNAEAEVLASFLAMIFMMGGMLLLMFFATGCSNWHGAEFRIGFGSYNGAQESRSYTAEQTKK